MNIHTIRDNLRNTIAGKEQLLAEHQANRQSEDAHVRMMSYPIVKMLELNVAELKKILADVEKCCEIETSRSWEGSVDRMSGAFDESELRGRDGWL